MKIRLNPNKMTIKNQFAYVVLMMIFLLNSCQNSFNSPKENHNYILYYKNGNIETIGTVDKNRKLHGTQYHFFDNGDSMYIFNYNHGILNGQRVRWWRNNIKASTVYYSNGIETRRILWDVDGTLLVDTVFK